MESSGEGSAISAELEAAIEKLNGAKKRVVVVANLLQGAQVCVLIQTSYACRF